MFNLQGLRFINIVEVPAKTNAQLYDSLEYETHACGGGDWSIEVYGLINGYREFIKEFVGSNGTQDDEEPTDLWDECAAWQSEWYNQEAKPAYSYKEYEAPDGTRGSYNYFQREVATGHLHGLVVCF